MEPNLQPPLPPWFEELDIEAIAAQLNPQLQEMLQATLTDEPGAEIASRMEITQIDSYPPEDYEQPISDELRQIIDTLNEELQSLLINADGVPREQAESAGVRRFGMQAATGLPRCEWSKCYDWQGSRWCTFYECCPCV